MSGQKCELEGDVSLTSNKLSVTLFDISDLLLSITLRKSVRITVKLLLALTFQRNVIYFVRARSDKTSYITFFTSLTDRTSLLTSSLKMSDVAPDIPLEC